MGRTQPRLQVRSVLTLACACVLLTGCSGSSAPAPPSEVVVFAAASLTEVMTDLGAFYEAAYRGTSVTLNLAGSQQLAAQLIEGARADVFASADNVQMAAVADAGLLNGEPIPFATTRLAIAVPHGNPAGIEDLADLAEPDVRVVLAAEEVPAGRYARQALAAAGVEVEAASLETNVRQVLARVALGEADAGIVYTSDIVATLDVQGVPIPDEYNVTVTYLLAVLRDAPNPLGARAFVDLVTEGGRIFLRGAGFGIPSPAPSRPR